MRPDDARAAVDRAVHRALETEIEGPRVAVAFSGGPDSTALLRSLARLRAQRPLEVAALHVDHGSDPGSGERARRARDLAARADVPFHLSGPDEDGAEPPEGSRGLEADARSLRYRALARCADRIGFESIWTAHHRDDQAETVLLRLLLGSGVAGLGGIEPRIGRWRRPLIAVPREVLHHSLDPGAPPPVLDPTNRDLRRPRNRVRRLLLPRWTAADPGLPLVLARLAGAARGARDRVEDRLVERLRIRSTPWGARLSRPEWDLLPAALRPWALFALHRVAGAAYPARRGAREELLRQLDRGEIARCPAGSGFRWEADARSLRLVRPDGSPPAFRYAIERLPARIRLREIGARLELGPTEPQDWMLRGSPRAAGLRIPDGVSGARPLRIEVRNRRPGDRFHPIGAPGRRRLKKILIDRKLPRVERDRLPLLIVEGEIAWIPGLAVGEAFRLHGDEQVVWGAKLVSEPAGELREPESFVGSFGLHRA